MCDQQSLRSACAYAQSDQSICLLLEYSIIFKLLTEHHLEFRSLKGGCRGSSESTHVKMPHCWKSHAVALKWKTIDQCVTKASEYGQDMAQSETTYQPKAPWGRAATASADSEGGTGGPDPLPPPPMENHKNIGFLSNTGPDPLKNHKATKLAFNVGPSSARQRNAI